MEQEETETTENYRSARSVFSAYFVSSRLRKSFIGRIAALPTTLIDPQSAVARLYEAGAGYSVGPDHNFNELKLTDGVSRLIIPGANLE
jgi:hypothetical protein